MKNQEYLRKQLLVGMKNQEYLSKQLLVGMKNQEYLSKPLKYQYRTNFKFTENKATENG